MDSTSSSDSELTIGRVAGHRGRNGELTVRVAAGDASVWDAVEQVRIALPTAAAREFVVEQARSYRDRLVLKLEGIDNADQAAQLRGGDVRVDLEQAPPLPDGFHFGARLVGMQVMDESHGPVGVVRDIVPTGGTDLLVVSATEGGDQRDDDEVLIPMAAEILLEVDDANRVVRVRMPPGLLELNRKDAP